MKKRIMITSAVTAAAALVGVLLITYFQPRDNFTGERVRNTDRYFLDFTSMTQTDGDVLLLEAGDTLHCRWDIRKGSVSIRIAAEGGEILYRTDSADTADFSLPIDAAGAYSVLITAKRAAGTIEITK